MAIKTLRIAVLILPPIQLLDLSPIDIFHMCSKEYLQDCGLPAAFVNLGFDKVEIHYVAEHGPAGSATSRGMDSSAEHQPIILAELTASAAIRITASFTSAQVQPGAIDIILVPGPDPKMVISEAAREFIRLHAGLLSPATSRAAGMTTTTMTTTMNEAVKEGKKKKKQLTTILSVCTGVIPLAQSGILDGRVCTGPRALLGMGLRKNYPDVKWTERRWEMDRDISASRCELWTAGGITNGQDMVAGYIRENFSRELADLVCGMADVGWRGREYGNGNAAEGAWWGWLLFRSWIGGLWSSNAGGKGMKGGRS